MLQYLKNEKYHGSLIYMVQKKSLFIASAYIHLKFTHINRSALSIFSLLSSLLPKQQCSCDDVILMIYKRTNINLNGNVIKRIKT